MLNCVDCGQEFAFTAGEQEFYAQRGFTESPKRCAGCRATRKAQRQSASHGAGGNGYDDTRASNGYAATSADGYATQYRERREREMFEATCADCGTTARVPFRPSGVRPVYCSDCFQNHR